MNFNGNDSTGFTGDIDVDNVCTNTLTAGQISVGECSEPPLFTLPITAPPLGVPGARAVMTALQSGSQVFRIPDSTFKFYFQDGVGIIHNVNVEFKAGDYDLDMEIFPAIEEEFQVVLAPTISSGVYTCTLNGSGHFTLSLTGGVSIQESRILSASLSDNGYLGSIGNSNFFGNSGSVSVPNLPTYTTVTNPVMAWEPYSMADVPAVTNPLDSNLDANSFSIKRLASFTLNELGGIPTLPPAGQFLVFAIPGILCTVDSSGVAQVYKQNQITALDSNAQITCSSGGIITMTCSTNLDLTNTTQVILPPDVHATSAVKGFNFNTGNNILRLNDATPYMRFVQGAITRFTVTDTVSQLLSPSGLVGFSCTDAATGIVGNVIFSGTGSCQFPDYDYPGVGAMTFGTVSATSVTIGKSGNTSAVNGRLLNNTSPVHYTLFSAIQTVAVSNTTTETSLLSTVVGSTTFPAADFVTGTTFGYEISGVCGIASTTLRIRLRGTTGGITGATLFDTGNMSVVVGDWTLTGTITFQILGAAGVCNARTSGSYRNSSQLVTGCQNNLTSSDTTIDNIFSFTATWGAANTSSVTQRICTIWRIY